MNDAVAARRVEQQRLIERARGYAQTLSATVPVHAVILVGSVARGDFNVWSDIDVLVIADDLPERMPDRLAVVHETAPSGLEVVGLTPEELCTAAARRNRLVLDAAAHGIVLTGSPDVLATVHAAERAARSDP